MLLVTRNTVVAVTAALISLVAGGVNTDYITPAFIFSPNHRYGVMVPVIHDDGAQEPDDRLNKVVELPTHRIVAVIHAEPGYNHALNFHETAPPRSQSVGELCLTLRLHHF